MTIGRPVEWHTKIDAPPEALEFYALIAKLQKGVAFRDCHVYTGTMVNDMPHVAFRKSTTNLPKTICIFLGIPYRKRKCGTSGCVNPFHHVDVAMQGAFSPNEGTGGLILPPIDLHAYKEVVDAVMDEEGIKPIFEDIRPFIPQEDMTDETLRKVIHEFYDKI